MFQSTGSGSLLMKPWLQRTWMVKRRQRRRSLARASTWARTLARAGAKASLATSLALALAIAEARARAAHVEVDLKLLNLARYVRLRNALLADVGRRRSTNLDYAFQR